MKVLVDAESKLLLGAAILGIGMKPSMLPGMFRG